MPLVARNNFADQFGVTANAEGYNNGRVGASMDDSGWKSGSSGNFGDVVAADEFYSVDTTDDEWLKLMRMRNDRVLGDGGTTPEYATSDIAGNTIPDTHSNIPVGCHIAGAHEDFVATPSSAHLVRLSESKLLSLGMHNTTYHGRRLLLGDYACRKNNDVNVHEDILIDNT
jgi:hypothetical protein